MWQLLALIATVTFAVARLLQRSLLKDGKHDSYTYAIYFQFLVALIILPVALLNNFAIPPLGDIWLQFLLMIFLYGFANVLFYLAVKQTPISEVMVIAATMPIWTTIAGIVFLGDDINSMKLLGILLAVAGIAFIFYEKSKIILHKGHFYALSSIVFYGLALTNDSFLLRHFNQTSYSFIYFILPAIFIALVNPKKVSDIKPFLAKNSGAKFFASAFLFAISALLINTSFQMGAQATQVGAMLQLVTIFTIVLGAIFLKEREKLAKKLIGGIIVIIGILLI